MREKEEFLAAEERKLSWVQKALGRRPLLYDTAILGPPIVQTKPELRLRPSWLEKLVGCFLVLFVSLFYPMFISVLFEGRGAQVWGAAGALLFLSGVLCALVWNSFFNPRYHLRIHINSHALTVGKESYAWTEINETALLQKMRGRYDNFVLVLFLQDGTVRSFDLYKFAITAKRLAGAIEFYKRSGAALAPGSRQ